MATCLIPNPNIDWDNIVEWICMMKGKCLQVILCKLYLVATVYHIWQLRNNLCHGNTHWIEEALVAQIKWELKLGFRLCIERGLNVLSFLLSFQSYGGCRWLELFLGCLSTLFSFVVRHVFLVVVFYCCCMFPFLWDCGCCC
jgi:hypothetical protein